MVFQGLIDMVMDYYDVNFNPVRARRWIRNGVICAVIASASIAYFHKDIAEYVNSIVNVREITMESCSQELHNIEDYLKSGKADEALDMSREIKNTLRAYDDRTFDFLKGVADNYHSIAQQKLDNH